jgi:uncharacterized membrane protein YphA (DoxX/SURF4 family)
MRRVRPAHAALWVAQVLLAAQFVIGGVAKLAEIGAGAWLRILVGGLELAGAIGLVTPRLHGPAALGLVGLMAGATVTNVFVLDASPLLPLVFGIVAAAIAWGRRSEIRDLVRVGAAR